MTESPTRRERIVTDLSSINTLVVLVAIVLAMPIAGYTVMSGIGFTEGIKFAGGFLLLLSIAVEVPNVYERYWPVEYTPAGAIAWTIAMSLVTAVLFIGSYKLFVVSMEAVLT